MPLNVKWIAKAAVTAVLGAAALLAGCAFMDLAWSRLTSSDDLARSNNITGAVTCREMSHHTFQTWLLFNPKNVQTYYIRSDCFMQVAVRVRDEEFCREVVERQSIYFNGSGVSEQACREAVLKRKEADEREAVAGDPHRIVTVTVDTVPGGDQADVRLRTEGSLPGTYELTYALLDAQGRHVGRLEAVTTPLGTTGTNSLGTMVYLRDVRKLLGHKYRPGERTILEVRLERVRGAGRSVPGRTEPHSLPSIAQADLVFE